MRCHRWSFFSVVFQKFPLFLLNDDHQRSFISGILISKRMSKFLLSQMKKDIRLNAKGETASVIMDLISGSSFFT